MDDFIKQLGDFIIFPLIGVIGGMVKYFNSLKSSKDFKWFNFFVMGLTSIFLGLLITFIGKASEMNPYYVGALSSVAGWMGVDFIKYIAKKYLGIDISDVKKPDQ